MTAHRFKVKISRCSSYTNCQFAFMPWHNLKIFIVRAPLAVSWLCNHLKYSSFPRHCFLACGWKFLQKLPALSLPPFFSSICSRQNSLCIKLKLNSNNIMPRELETIFILFHSLLSYPPARVQHLVSAFMTNKSSPPPSRRLKPAYTYVWDFHFELLRLSSFFLHFLLGTRYESVFLSVE